ncbi:MAG: phosphoadenylyl-sulfate reductase [Candidatus Dormibacteraeota bacterium]|nr:phosphoadenylyl-sulfate reductase [Candidatus Dormibacteraeota bacterium]
MSSQTPLQTATPLEVLDWTYKRFARPVLVSSFQAESGVLIDMATRVADQVEVITLDTGRLPQETHEVIDAFRERYPSLRVRIESPDAADLRRLTDEHGANPFYRSVELRRLCCEVRKTRPLERALEGHDAWITGLRRDQGASRADTPVVAEDEAHGGIAKVAPLATWTREQVWDYLRERKVPYHPLYERSYTSIGCAPCTRPTAPGEDERAGRWWWELDEVKECGLHWTPDGRPERRATA